MPAFVLRWVYRCDYWEMPVVVNQVVERLIYITQTPLEVAMIQCSSDSTRFLKPSYTYHLKVVDLLNRLRHKKTSIRSYDYRKNMQAAARKQWQEKVNPTAVTKEAGHKEYSAKSLSLMG